MGKVITIIFVCTALLSVGVNAFAIDSPTSESAYYEYAAVKTSALPKIVGEIKGIVLTEYADYANLDKNAQQIYKDARKAVKDGAPEGMTSKYLFYVSADRYPTELVVEIKGADEVSAKLFKDGKWDELSITVNECQYTITINEEGPVSIYTK